MATRGVATLFGEHARHLPLGGGAAVGLYAGALLAAAHQPGMALLALLAGAGGGLALEYELSRLVQVGGYILGVMSVSLAVPATPLAVLGYGPWVVLGALLFPGWAATLGLVAAGVGSYIGASQLEPAPPGIPWVLIPAGAIAVFHLGAAFAAREVQTRSRLALTDPLTGLANRRLMHWRLTEELAQLQRNNGTLAFVYLDVQDFRQINQRFGHRAGDRVLAQIAQILRDTMRVHDVIARMDGEEFAVLAPGLGEADAATVVERLRVALARATTLPFPLRLAAGWAIAPRDGTQAEALVEFALGELFDQKQQVRWTEPSLPMDLTEALWSLPGGAQQMVRLLHTDGIEPEDHLARVGKWSLELARLSELDPARCQALAQAVLLHDVGKLVLPRSLLRKPGPLSAEEQALIVRHATSGVALLRALGVDEAVVAIVAAHHERWDGGGYPAGLAGEAIPIEARILAIADGCDAMTARRPYRKTWKINEVVADLQLEGGRRFDPKLVELIIPLLAAPQ